MEEGVVNEILKGPLRDVFDCQQLITDVSGSGNNWLVYCWTIEINDLKYFEYLKPTPCWKAASRNRHEWMKEWRNEEMNTYWPLPSGFFLGPIKQSIEINLTGSESQLAAGKPVGYIQGQPRSWAKDYLEQIRLVIRAGLELRICRFQVRHPDYLAATLPPHDHLTIMMCLSQGNINTHSLLWYSLE